MSRKVTARISFLSVTALMMHAAAVQADPPSGIYPPFAGIGDQSTDFVMDAIAASVKDSAGNWVIGSYMGSGPSRLLQTQASNSCLFPGRPSGGNWGVVALENSIHTGVNCVAFARSGAPYLHAVPTQSMTYLPYAKDAIAVAQTKTTALNSVNSIATLVNVYTCQADPIVKPLLPAFGSALRYNFLTALGLKDSLAFTHDYPCVHDSDTNHKPYAENDGTILDEYSLVPYSAANFVSQLRGAQPDRHGTALLQPVVYDQFGRLLPSLNQSPFQWDPRRKYLMASNCPTVNGVPATTFCGNGNPNPAVSFAISQSSALALKQTIAQLVSIYNCTVPGITPLLPVYGSPIRAAFMSELGFTDSRSFTASRPCITTLNSQAIDGTQIGTKNIAPYDSTWVTQASTGTGGGGARVGNIADLAGPAVAANPAGAFNYTHYIAVPTATLSSTPFAGGLSAVMCTASAKSIMWDYGFNYVCNYSPIVVNP